MNLLTTSQVLTSHFKTSIEGDRITAEIMDALGVDVKAVVARLAISRSLALGRLGDDAIDSKGMDVPGKVLFKQQDVGLWIGLIATHAQTTGDAEITSLDSFRLAVRKHWFRGVQLLQADWEDSDRNYDKFLETLIIRRADLPEVGKGGTTKNGGGSGGEEPDDISANLVKALVDIGVIADIKGLIHGPRVTRYKLFLADINHLDKLRRGLERLGLALNLQRAMPILAPGDEARTLSLDIPRPTSTWRGVGFTEFKVWVAANRAGPDELMLYPGVDVLGKPFAFDLVTTPHLLVGGTTGSGKSVCLHALILSLIARLTPSDLQLALIDPKQVEFTVYKSCDYLYRDEIATDPSAAKELLIELVAEMEARYQTFAAASVANIQEARKKKIAMPYIAVFIEELFDLLLADKDIEVYIVRLAAKARAAGIHLVVATQRPDAKTFSGQIRSNIPARIALTVQKSTESKIILDEQGAEDLLGSGDMLIRAKPSERPERVHGVRINREDIEIMLRDRSKKKNTGL